MNTTDYKTETLGYNRSTLLEMLHNRVVEVKFYKADGSRRVLLGTLKEEFLPERPKIEEIQTKEVNLDVVTVWDMESEDWRSIRTDRIYEVT